MPSFEFLFVIALVFYTLVVWVHKIKNRLELWMVVVFGIALAIDTVATVIVCVLANQLWAWNPHTITGFASLVIMATHFIWAVETKIWSGDWEIYFHRYSPYAWFLWLVAFFSGIPLAG